MNALKPISKNHFPKYKDNVDKLLQNLQDHEILWRPYDLRMLPAHMSEQEKFGTLFAPMFCMNFVVYHKPHRFAKQFRVFDRYDVSASASAFDVELTKHKENSGNTNQDFITYYTKEFQAWENAKRAEEYMKEVAMKSKEEELNAIIFKLETKISPLKESLANEESYKLDALDCHTREKEARMASEKTLVSVREELRRVEQSALSANEKVKTQEDMYKKLQEYNMKLQNELKTANDANKQVEKEKAAILENHTTLRGHYNVLQKEFTSAKDSRDDAFKQKEVTIEILRAELQQVREDRERQLLQVQELSSQLNEYKENSCRTVVEVNSLLVKSITLEETCSSQREEISVLQHQLAAATQKLKMADLSSSEIRTEYQEQKRVVSELQERLRDAENQILEEESLRRREFEKDAAQYHFDFAGVERQH